jgi:hypothetical protein
MGMMEKMMEECCPGMTADEKKKMMGEMMPKVIMAMMGGGEGEAGMEGMMMGMGPWAEKLSDADRGELLVLKGQMMKKHAEIMKKQAEAMIAEGKRLQESGK